MIRKSVVDETKSKNTIIIEGALPCIYEISDKGDGEWVATFKQENQFISIRLEDLLEALEISKSYKRKRSVFVLFGG